MLLTLRTYTLYILDYHTDYSRSLLYLRWRYTVLLSHGSVVSPQVVLRPAVTSTVYIAPIAKLQHTVVILYSQPTYPFTAYRL